MAGLCVLIATHITTVFQNSTDKIKIAAFGYQQNNNVQYI